MSKKTTSRIFAATRSHIWPRAFNNRGILFRWILALLAVSGLLVSSTMAYAQAPAAEAGVDASILPGDDFFAYANGSWLKSTEIPVGKERWTVGSEIIEQARKQVAKLLDDAIAKPKGSSARKVADYRAAYLNEAAIESKGIAPIKALLDRIDRVRDKATLTRYLGSSIRADVDPLNNGVYASSQLLGLAV